MSAYIVYKLLLLLLLLLLLRLLLSYGLPEDCPKTAVAMASASSAVSTKSYMSRSCCMCSGSVL